MPFQQFKLDRSVQQTRGIFDKYVYSPDNGDTSAIIQTPGYFADSRFKGGDWEGSILEINASDAYLIAQITPNDMLNVLFDSSTQGGSGVDSFNGRTGDVLPVEQDYQQFFLDRMNNVVVVNQESDFPVQDGSSITLEDDNVYVICDSFATSKQFVCGSCTMTSLGLTETPLITYTGTLPMFDVTESFFYMVRMTWSATNAYSFDIKGSGGGLLNERANVQDSICYGTRDVALVSGAASLLVSNTQIVFTPGGTNLFDIDAGTGAILSFRQVGIIGTVAGSTIFNMDNAAIYGAAEWTDVFCTGDATTTFIDGATASGNVAPGALFTVNGCNIASYTTPLSGVDVNDDGWLFSANDGLQESTINGHAYMPATTTVIINTVGIFEKVAGGGWFLSNADRVSISADGDITNSGSRPISVLVQGSVTVDTGGLFFGDGVAVRIVKNSDTTATEAVASEAFVDSFNETDAYVAGSFVLDPGDSVAIWVANLDDTTNIPVPRGKLIVFGKV